MSLILREGDYVPDGRGGFQTAEGARELLERILWKLTVKRGSFPLLPQLGSRLHLLGRAPQREWEALAQQYVREALSDEEVTVEEVTLSPSGEGAFLTVQMTWQGEPLTATVELGGLA